MMERKLQGPLNCPKSLARETKKPQPNTKTHNHPSLQKKPPNKQKKHKQKKRPLLLKKVKNKKVRLQLRATVNKLPTRVRLPQQEGMRR